MKLTWLSRLATAATILLPAGLSLADVKLASVFSDHMVLQREIELPVWGTADAGEEVTVNFAGQKQTIKAAADGKWSLKLQPLRIIDEPAELLVTGKNRLAIKDVVVGDVWVCSGHSNMSFAMNRTDNAEKEIAEATNAKIRLFTVPRKTSAKPLDSVNAQWELCTPQTARNFSAVAYFFGRHLARTVNVPIGLIHTSWGGTVAEAWTDKSALESDPDFAPILERGAKYASQYPKLLENYQKQEQAFKEKQKAGVKGTAPRKPAAPDNNQNAPSVLYNAMIAPLVPYGIKGVIWYQGEANASRGEQYRKLLPALIKDWRTAWSQEEPGQTFPFLIVQLANYGKDDPQGKGATWPELREAQWLTSRKTPNCGIAVTIDIGNPADIHPTNKQDVGKRLGLTAEKLVYGRDVVYSGPVYKSMSIDGSKVKLTFDHAERGIEAKGGKLEGFTVAGEDKVFHPAEATMEGNAVVLSCPQVTKPTAVRYGWMNSPTCTLYNKEGLPAVPFRTDDWPMVSAGAK